MISAAPLLVSLVLGASTDPYFRTRADLCPPQTDQHCLWWPGKSTVTFRQNARGNPATDPTGTGVFDAVTRSWQTWQGIMNDCGSLTITEGAQTDDKSIGYDSSNPSANQNIVIFRQQSCLAPGVVPPNHTCTLGTGDCGSVYDCWDHDANAIALTTTTYDKCSGRIYDADVEMNGKMPGDTSTDGFGKGFHLTLVDSPPCPTSRPDYNCVAADIRNTATHEFGHSLGLDHICDNCVGGKFNPIFDPCDPGCPATLTSYTHSTMYAQAPPGDLCKRCVDSGSRQFICDVYPKGKTAVDCVASKSGGCSAAPAGPMIALALLGIRILATRRDRRRR